MFIKRNLKGTIKKKEEEDQQEKCRMLKMGLLGEQRQKTSKIAGKWLFRLFAQKNRNQRDKRQPPPPKKGKG